MGCASSKQKRCRHCNHPYSPVPRSYSMHLDHESQHVVALTSTTLGTLKLSSPTYNHRLPDNVAGTRGNEFNFFNGKVTDSDSFRFANGTNYVEKKSEILDSERKEEEEFSMGLIEAKTWSSMIEQKLQKVTPRTPTTTPPGEPETIINTWELMEGLEDTSPFRSPNRVRSFSFDLNDTPDPPRRSNFDAISSPKPMWLQMTEEESRLSPAIPDFDPEVISSFRKSLQQLSPDSPFHLRPPQTVTAEDEIQGTGKEFSPEETKMKTKCDDIKLSPSGKQRVLFYFTSLRGVRRTYEQCCKVRMILKGLGVRVDERDVSMHSGFKEELRELLGDDYGRGGLPRVFVGRSYVGSAEEIQKLHEEGKLEKLLDCCEKFDDSGGGGGECEACGDVRFLPCETCSGSCKIYYESDEDEEAEEDGECGFQRCPDCNENGLIRCPMCC